jgi:hypothetical protein
VSGWASLTVLVSFLSGATLISIGIVGEYVGKIYEQAKNRPLYLASRTLNIGIDAANFRSRSKSEGDARRTSSSNSPLEL